MRVYWETFCYRIKLAWRQLLAGLQGRDLYQEGWVVSVMALRRSQQEIKDLRNHLTLDLSNLPKRKPKFYFDGEEYDDEST